MPTIDSTTGGTLGYPYVKTHKSFILSGVYDATKDVGAAADVVQVLTIPAGTMVQEVITDVDTIEDSTLTFDVGDGVDPNGWEDAVNGETLGKTKGDGAFEALGKLYLTADTIDMTLDDAADTVKVTIRAICHEV